MSQAHLGGRIRRLRQEHKLTQVQLAEQLGISPSYLNLIEHNQRPVTVPILLKLAQRFGLDLQSFTADDDPRLINDLMEVFADPVFDGHGIKSTELKEMVGAMPEVARAVLTLYQAWRGGRSPSVAPDEDEATPVPAGMPSEEVSDFLQERNNYFRDLESAAEALWRDGNLAQDRLYHGLIEVLATQFAVDVEVLPSNQTDNLLRAYDPKRRRLVLSELMSPASRTFQLAHQIALLGHHQLLERLGAGGKFTTIEADKLVRVTLANYFAAAVMMPYDRFLTAARETRHDIELLERRFGASFEQICHRLTNLRRPGAQGVPFHLVRVDVAGNISKRFAGSGMAIARFGGACPRWNLYDAFATPGMIRRQVVRMPEGSTYFCIARTTGSSPRPTLRGHNARATGRHAIGLGCAIAHARELVYADGVALDDPELVTPIGVSCRRCERTDCADRAMPSLHHKLTVDENRRGLSTFVATDTPV